MKNETPNKVDQTAAPVSGGPAAASCPAPADPQDGGFISKNELARRLNRSLRTIDYWRRRGVIPCIKCGHSPLFKWTDVQAHLEKHFRVCATPTERLLRIPVIAMTSGNKNRKEKA